MSLHVRIFKTTSGLPIERFAADPSDARVTVTTSPRYEPCDIAVMYGAVRQNPDNIAGAARQNIVSEHHGPLIMIETGFIGRQFEMRPIRRIKATLGLLQPAESRSPYLRVGLGGAFGDDSDFCNSSSPPDRWEFIKSEFSIKLAPYRENGGHILLIGQVPADASLRGADIKSWLIDAAAELRRHSGRPIKLRLHPVTARNDQIAICAALKRTHSVALANPLKPIWTDLHNAWACVTYSSSSAVEALIAGVPTICVSPASIAYSISSRSISDIENPKMPDREQWFRDLCYAQWTFEEMASGAVWRHLRGRLTA